MEVLNCKTCGKLFNYIGGQRLCPGCKKDLEDKFQQVKKYVYDHKDAPVAEVAEENDVSVRQIKQWVREERLSFSEATLIGIECEACGVPIQMGKYCEACKKKLANNLGQLYHKEQPEQVKKDPREKARMRFLDS